MSAFLKYEIPGTVPTTEVVDRILALEIDGRNLELWMPLFITAALLGDACFSRILKLAVSKVKDHQEQEMTDDLDTKMALFLIDYLRIKAEQGYFKLTDIRNDFIKAEQIEKDYLTSRWVAKYLSRINAIKSRRRVGSGIEVEINYEKIKHYCEVRGMQTNEDGTLKATLMSGQKSIGEPA